jgi:hypothetical protein
MVRLFYILFLLASFFPMNSGAQTLPPILINSSNYNTCQYGTQIDGSPPGGPNATWVPQCCVNLYFQAAVSSQPPIPYEIMALMQPPYSVPPEIKNYIFHEDTGDWVGQSFTFDETNLYDSHIADFFPVDGLANSDYNDNINNTQGNPIKRYGTFWCKIDLLRYKLAENECNYIKYENETTNDGGGFFHGIFNSRAGKNNYVISVEDQCQGHLKDPNTNEYLLDNNGNKQCPPCMEDRRMNPSRDPTSPSAVADRSKWIRSAGCKALEPTNPPQPPLPPGVITNPSWNGNNPAEQYCWDDQNNLGNCNKDTDGEVMYYLPIAIPPIPACNAPASADIDNNFANIKLKDTQYWKGDCGRGIFLYEEKEPINTNYVRFVKFSSSDIGLNFLPIKDENLFPNNSRVDLSVAKDFQKNGLAVAVPGSADGSTVRDDYYTLKDGIWDSFTGCYNPEERFAMRAFDFARDSDENIKFYQPDTLTKTNQNKSGAFDSPIISVDNDGKWQNPVEFKRLADSSDKYPIYVPQDRVIARHPYCVKGTTEQQISDRRFSKQAVNTLVDSGHLPACLADDIVDDQDNFCTMFDASSGFDYDTTRYVLKDGCWEEFPVAYIYKEDADATWLPKAIRPGGNVGDFPMYTFGSNRQRETTSGNYLGEFGFRKEDIYKLTPKQIDAGESPEPMVYTEDVTAALALKAPIYNFNPHNVYNPDGDDLAWGDFSSMDAAMFKNLGRKHNRKKCLELWIQEYAFKADRGEILVDEDIQKLTASVAGIRRDASMCQWVAYYNVAENYPVRSTVGNLLGGTVSALITAFQNAAPATNGSTNAQITASLCDATNPIGFNNAANFPQGKSPKGMRSEYEDDLNFRVASGYTIVDAGMGLDTFKLSPGKLDTFIDYDKKEIDFSKRTCNTASNLNVIKDYIKFAQEDNTTPTTACDMSSTIIGHRAINSTIGTAVGTAVSNLGPVIGPIVEPIITGVVNNATSGVSLLTTEPDRPGVSVLAVVPPLPVIAMGLTAGPPYVRVKTSKMKTTAEFSARTAGIKMVPYHLTPQIDNSKKGLPVVGFTSASSNYYVDYSWPARSCVHSISGAVTTNPNFDDAWEETSDIELQDFMTALTNISNMAQAFTDGTVDASTLDTHIFGGFGVKAERHDPGPLYKMNNNRIGTIKNWYSWLPMPDSLTSGLQEGFWCDFALPYNPYMKGFVEEVFAKAPDVTSVAPGLPGINNPPKDGWKPKLDFYRVERIRDPLCGSFASRSTWMQDPNNELSQWLMGTDSRCQNWKGMFAQKYDDPKIISWRLARFDYEFLKAFIECTGPVKEAPNPCELSTDSLGMNVLQGALRITAVAVIVAQESVAPGTGQFKIKEKQNDGLGVIKRLGDIPALSIEAIDFLTRGDTWYGYSDIDDVCSKKKDEICGAGNDCDEWTNPSLTNVTQYGYCDLWQFNEKGSAQRDKFWLDIDNSGGDLSSSEKEMEDKPFGFWCSCREDNIVTTRCREDMCTCEQHVLVVGRMVPGSNLSQDIADADGGDIGSIVGDNIPSDLSDSIDINSAINTQATSHSNNVGFKIGSPIAICKDYGPYRRWLQCYYQAQAKACPVITRDVSDGVADSRVKVPTGKAPIQNERGIVGADGKPVYQMCDALQQVSEFNFSSLTASNAEKEFLRWKFEEPNHLARLPVRYDSAGAGYKHFDLVFQSQVRDIEAPYMELAVPFPIELAEDKYLKEISKRPSVSSISYNINPLLIDKSASNTARLESLYIKGLKAAAEGFNYTKKSKYEDIHPRAQDAIVGPRGCGIGGWYEMMLYQARCIKWFKLNCMCDYDKTFARGNSENFVYEKAGAEFDMAYPVYTDVTYEQQVATEHSNDPVNSPGNVVKIRDRFNNQEPLILYEAAKDANGKPIVKDFKGVKVRSDITRVHPLADRGIIGPEFAKNSNEDFALWKKSDYQGLNEARVGDIGFYDEELYDDMGVGYPRHAFYIKSVKRTGTASYDFDGDGVNETTGDVVYVEVEEKNWGKHLDSCGNTDMWDRITTRKLWNPRFAAQNLASCANADWKQCKQFAFEKVKVYRPYYYNAANDQFISDPEYSSCAGNLPKPITRDNLVAKIVANIGENLVSKAQNNGESAENYARRIIDSPDQFLNSLSTNEIKQVLEDDWLWQVVGNKSGQYSARDVFKYLYSPVDGAVGRCDPPIEMRKDYKLIMNSRDIL